MLDFIAPFVEFTVRVIFLWRFSIFLQRDNWNKPSFNRKSSDVGIIACSIYEQMAFGFGTKRFYEFFAFRFVVAIFC